MIYTELIDFNGLPNRSIMHYWSWKSWSWPFL